MATSSGVDDSAARASLDTVEGLSAPSQSQGKRTDPAALAETIDPAARQDFTPTRPRSGTELERALAKARAEERLLGAVATRVEIGRFSIVDRLGQGAMGVVYAGYDPKLDRKVAIKLVDPSRLGSEAGNAQARLEREARAAADLSHPNVVTVYDVGLHDGGVFLAMEHVEGTTLTEWMKEDRAWRETLAMFLQIGEGLAAAHEAGIVHRDFKPDNVLVGSDGRPRIADFGLARPVEGWTAREEQGHRPTTRGRNVSSVLATTGEVCGTPAYMAPEQFDGLDVGPHSDQFGFCVSLFEALFGFRPFKGSSITALASRVIEGHMEPLPPNHGVPREVIAVVERGLRPSAEDRHESMAALVARLDGVVRRRRRRVMVVGAMGLASVAVAGGYQVNAAQQVDPCEAIDAPIDAVWSDAQRVAVGDAVGDASDVVAAVDQYVADWRGERREACEATRVHGEQSDLALELRMACLDQAAARAEGIVAELAAPDQTIRRPERLVTLLRPLDECADLERLERMGDRMRRGTLTPAEIEAQREGTELIARAEARRLAGRDGAPELLEQALEMFEGADYKTMQGVAHIKLAGEAIGAGDLVDASEHLELASNLALVTGHDENAADAALLSSFVALERGQTKVAELHLQYAEGLVERAVDPSTRELLRATAGFRRAALLAHKGEPAAAQKVLDGALSVLGEHPRAPADLVGSAFALAGSIAIDEADIPGAVEAYAAALEHLDRANVHGLDEAYQRANLAFALGLMHRFEDAGMHYERAQEILGQLYGEDHVGVAVVLTSRGWLAREAGDLEAARPFIEQALKIFQRATPDGHPNWATALDNLADIDRREGKYDDALARLDRARAIRVQLYGEDHEGLGYTQLILGRVHADMGQLDRAAEPLSQALEIFRRPGASPSDLAEAEVAMARAVRDSDPARSEALIAAARRRMPTDVPFPVRYAEDLDKLEAASGN